MLRKNDESQKLPSRRIHTTRKDNRIQKDQNPVHTHANIRSKRYETDQVLEEIIGLALHLPASEIS